MNSTMNTANDRPISYAPAPAAKAPLSERVNFRMIIFAAVVLFLIGWPVYTFLSESLTHGIHNRAGYKEVNLKALGQFDFDRDGGTLTDVPAQYRNLDGQKVLLEGEVFAPNESRNITSWELVYSIQKCCFNGPPRVQERVFCSAPSDKSFPIGGGGYHKVMGTLHVTLKHTKLPDGKPGPVEEVYHLDAESVEQS
jgi:hypothetical protein